MGIRSYPCTRHRYNGERVCIRCGLRQRVPRVFVPRRKHPDVDVMSLARNLERAILAWINPPKAMVPRDPSSRTKQWEYNARVWEACKQVELDRLCWSAYEKICTIAQEPCYSRANKRMARRIVSAVRKAKTPTNTAPQTCTLFLLPGDT